MQRRQKKETSSNEKMPRNWQKRTGKSAATQGEKAEIDAEKALKFRIMPPIEYSKMLPKYKFWIYYRMS